MEKKRVIHVAECFSGGVYDFISNLIVNMPEFEHTILYGKRWDTKENFQVDFPENIRFIYWKNATREISPKKDFFSGVELYKVLSQKEYSTIHLHSSKAGFIGRMVARLKNQQSKVIYTTHGVSFARCDVSQLKIKFYLALEKIASLMGGKIIACSKSEADLIIGKGIKNAEYIFNGIDLKKQERSYQRKDSFSVVTIGRMTYQKNPKLFNEIAELFRDNPKVKFKWIGDGELRKEIKSNNIEVTGWLSQEGVKEGLLASDLYLSTSLWEGLPLSVLQAMSKGLPLILSDCIGNSDLVVEGENGYIYKDREGAAEKIRYLLENKGKIEELRKKSPEILKNRFSNEKMIREYSGFYLGEK